MAARKTTARRSARKGGSPIDRLTQELPPTLRDFRTRVERQLNALQEEVVRRSAPTRRQAAQLLRDASRQLGRLEAEGESGFRRLAENARQELVRLLSRLEKAIDPGALKRRANKAAGTAKTRTRKATSAARSALSDAADRIGS
jgi:hypothetical protein